MTSAEFIKWVDNRSQFTLYGSGHETGPDSVEFRYVGGIAIMMGYTTQYKDGAHKREYHLSRNDHIKTWIANIVGRNGEHVSGILIQWDGVTLRYCGLEDSLVGTKVTPVCPKHFISASFDYDFPVDVLTGSFCLSMTETSTMVGYDNEEDYLIAALTQ